MGWLSEHGPQVVIVLAFLAFLRFFTKESFKFFRNHMTKNTKAMTENTKALENITETTARLVDKVSKCPERPHEGEG